MPETRKTLRSVTLTIYDQVPNFDEISDKVKYFAYGDEVCPTTGRAHKQGFAYAHKPMRFTTWKSLFPTAHIEEMRGNLRQNIDYCSKESTLIEHGEKPMENGKKRSFQEFHDRMHEGEKIMDIATSGDAEMSKIHCMYGRGLEKQEQYLIGKRLEGDYTMPEVYIRWGEAGSGKTRYVFENEPQLYTMPDNTAQWLGNYNGEPAVLFDDVEANSIPTIGLFKRLLDRYPKEYPIKGGFVWFKPKRIYITSNSHWTTWWKNLTEEDKAAFTRRFTSVKYLRRDGTESEEHAVQT